ncbi:hypothetical protein RJ639_018333 [Escallonia herrerae]|uniref:Uncharacterized protein n=1 Tax=Escallonia herrerae TaxID=1293975 RepID=A0AA88V750_9ASTE|nr:hypothetical protein RJ639_018333 [Escallonia herrerae]
MRRTSSAPAPAPYPPQPAASTTSVHVTALDGLVNVNSLFTIAVFVGLSLTTPGQRSLENRAPCDADVGVAKKLLVFEVVSFSFFLFSSLVAQGLKLAINLLNSKDVDEIFRAHINIKVLRFGMLGSAVGSVMGCLFLMLSMVNVIEIRLGMLSCGSKSAVHAVATMIVLRIDLGRNTLQTNGARKDFFFNFRCCMQSFQYPPLQIFEAKFERVDAGGPVAGEHLADELHELFRAVKVGLAVEIEHWDAGPESQVERREDGCGDDVFGG